MLDSVSNKQDEHKEIIMGRIAFKDLFLRPGKSKDKREKPRETVSDRTVLIVDDSRTVVHALKTILEQADYSTLAASDGKRGIELAIEYKPDLILMDIVMPGINGFKATRLLRKEPLTEGIPIIIMSGNEQATEKFWGMRLGANEFLSKPIQRGLLFKMLDDFILKNKTLKKEPADKTTEYDLLYD